MKNKLFLAVLLAGAAPVAAQDTIQSGSASDANAVSGSQSGASSDNFNTNNGGNNAGIGNSTSGSASNSDAVSGSNSAAESNGNQQGQTATGGNSMQGQDQGQAQSANNTQGQTATGGSNTSNQTTGQMALNEQGVTVNQTWNSNQRRKTVQEFRTNAAVPLAASSSFSSDYCGGTASGGVSAAPIGISIGGAGPTFDKSCQNLRRAEKFGMAAANWHNLGYEDRAVAMMQMMEWSICNSDSRGMKTEYEVAQACNAVLGSPLSAPTPPATYQQPVTPLETQKPNVTPEQQERYKTPRGEIQYDSKPMVQDLSFNDVPLTAVAPPAHP